MLMRLRPELFFCRGQEYLVEFLSSLEGPEMEQHRPIKTTIMQFHNYRPINKHQGLIS